jgi:hypothetical protein
MDVQSVERASPTTAAATANPAVQRSGIEWVSSTHPVGLMWEGSVT